MAKQSSNHIDIEFATLKSAPKTRACVVLSGSDLAFSPIVRELDEKTGGLIETSAKAADFSGKAKSSIEILAPRGLKLDRLLVVGCGDASEKSEDDWTMLGGTIMGLLGKWKVSEASLVAEISETTTVGADVLAAILAFGIQLRHYKFRKYITRDSGDDDNGDTKDGLKKLIVHCASPAKAQAAFVRYRAVANGVHMARDLVNEPANVLDPVEFANRAKSLSSLGVEVDILGDAELKKLKMGALLCVGQGSVKPSRVAVMRWNGAKSKKDKPIAIVGKGVVFDTGGISIKPSAGMGDMKGDMGGAACVTGLMRTLAERKAKVNVVGLIGCVENMPSGSAVRPGDIVTSMSGQTIEVLNTDAEGRLVLADVVWYAQEKFKPKLVIDLATLTGAIMMALGKEYAGLFSNDDTLVEGLVEASEKTGEKVWRMPLGKVFDKAIDTPNADVKNLGGRWAGACTAAQFIKRFVKDDTKWAHIDLAGPAMDAPRNAINPSWGSGWGVRLLDRYICDVHEG